MIQNYWNFYIYTHGHDPNIAWARSMIFSYKQLFISEVAPSTIYSIRLFFANF